MKGAGATSLLAPPLLLLLFVALALRCRKRAVPSSRPIVLSGSRGAGKTALLFALAGWSAPPDSCTSMEVNDIELPNSRQRVLDLPGHPRLRGDRKQPLSRARAVVVVVDSASLARGAREAADSIEEALQETQSDVSILVAASKSDSLSALSVRHVRKRVEKEMAEQRDNRSFSLDSCGRSITFLSVSVMQLSSLLPVAEFMGVKPPSPGTQ